MLLSAAPLRFIVSELLAPLRSAKELGMAVVIICETVHPKGSPTSFCVLSRCSICTCFTVLLRMARRPTEDPATKSIRGKREY